MPKRRKNHDDSKDDTEVVKKRRRSAQGDATEVCQELYDIVRSYKTDDNRLLCEAFIRVPKRRNSSEYYDVVTNPIDMLKIQQKLRVDEYDDLEQLTADFEVLVNNAKSYYKKTSQEYKDACQLWDVLMAQKQQLLAGMVSKVKEDSDDHEAVDSSTDNASSEVSRASCSTPKEEEDNPYEALFAAVMTATDLDGRVYSTSVQLLPSRRRFPDYYKIIKEPMDLKMIAAKIQNNSYQSLNELESDLLLIVRNVKTYNVVSSQIYKDAVALRRIMTSKRLEIENGRTTGSKTSERIRQRRLAGGQKLSAITAALQYESEGEDGGGGGGASGGSVGQEQNDDDEAMAEDDADEDEDDSDEDSSSEEEGDTRSPCWQLFDSVIEHQAPQGYSLAEPFMKLPSRKIYPDYFKEIKNPMSLQKIRTRVENKHYSSVSDMVDDLQIMFDNAKHYNRPDSKLYKDAVKLQKFMLAKAKDLISLEKEDSDEEEENDEEEEEEEEEEVEETDEPATKRRNKKASIGGEERKKPGRRSADADLGVKKRMRLLYHSLVEVTDDAGRALIPLFMERPSKKNYPDYYQVITEPIDMKQIDSSIRGDKYECEEALVSDFMLMFRNCRQYNEEDSQIYRDANTLEAVLIDKIQELSVDSPKLKIMAKKSKAKASPQVTQKLRTLFENIKEYVDKGRKVSSIFMKLPSRTEYPEYYEVIKRPVDMQKIQTRLNSGYYESLEEMLSDFVLMFDNACKYNEPDSQIYKDALTLQRVTLQTKMELSEDEDGTIPDVRPLVQELLTTLFTYVYNHQDEEGRCYSDSLAELSEGRAADKEAARILTLDMVKKNLDKGRYRRLDSFQDDMFDVLETARKVSRTDSQVFEDSIELQMYFIKKRDELCKNGDVLSSPAAKITEVEVQASVDTLRADKLPREKSDDESDREQDKPDKPDLGAHPNNSESCVFRDQVYHVKDYVYIEPREKCLEPHIIHIEKLWKDDLGEQWLYGCWFYRPNETFHLATRKFLEKEVFKSDNYNSAPMNQVLGKCHVLFVKDYFKFKPEGFLDKDVYVCESRYSAKAKNFKKILKIWPAAAHTPHVNIVPRETPLITNRVPSVFKDNMERQREDSMDSDDFNAKFSDKEKPNVAIPGATENTITYYEQFNIPSGRYKLGDCVYVRSENGRQLIARIDQMWEDKSQGSFFHGPWFVTPQEITHPPTRLFHKQEVFLSSIEDTNPLLSITGHCYVMELKDYVRCRPTEISEQDVFVCESRYMEAERQIRKLTKGLKKFLLSSATEDEIYYFKKPISTQKTEHSESTQVMAVKTKVQTCSEPSPLLPKVSDAEMEDSNDGLAPSVCSNEAPTPTPMPSTKKKVFRRLVTGYILYAGEVRKTICQKNPDASFGDISRKVGNEWRNLPAEQKADYEERAQKANEESASRYPPRPTAESAQPPTPLQQPAQPAEVAVGFECRWEKCELFFEDQQDLIEHLVGENVGHIFQKYQDTAADSAECQCLWYNCARVKKNQAPFQNLQRLLRHCREVHAKSSVKSLVPSDRGKNFVPSKIAAANRPHTPVQGYPQGYAPGYPPPRFPGYPSMPGGPLLHPGTPHHMQLMPPDSTYYPHQQTCMSPVPCSCQHKLGMQRQYLSDYYSPRHSLFGPVNEASQHNQHLPAGHHSTPSQTIARPPDPMFVAVPPKSNRLVHSEAYLRYIEGLQPENRMISNWDSNLRASQDNTPLQDSGRLPVHWLGNGAGNHGNTVNALWALRDYMLKDSLHISKIL